MPFADSITLAGGAFAVRDGLLQWATGSACFAPDTPANGMRHTVAVSAGSTITALSVRARNSSIYEQNFNVTLWAQRPGTTGGVQVHSAPFTVAAGQELFESRVELPTPELADPGEALYLSFSPATGSTWLCAAEIEFHRPG